MFNLASTLARLDLDPLALGLQIVDAAELAREFFPRLDTDRPALVLRLSSQALARRVQATLRVNYPAGHPVTLLVRKRKQTATLESMARPATAFTGTTALYLPPLPHPGSPLTLAAIVARLRAPNGCPWDREQTHASLRRALVEEAYEVLEAIGDNDPAQLEEELGDLLLHVLFQTQIARDDLEFALSDVGAELAAKLIRRHPHVFGQVEVADAQQVIANWERIKQEEKAVKGKASNGLDANIPRDLPSLPRAQKVYDRAKRSKVPAPGKPSAALARKLARARDREQVLGDLLLELAVWAEQHGLDAESALRAATARFVEGAKEKD